MFSYRITRQVDRYGHLFYHAHSYTSHYTYSLSQFLSISFDFTEANPSNPMFDCVSMSLMQNDIDAANL